jgi:Putative DNA-binding domain
MAGWIPPRLRTLLGPDLDAVDAGALERLVGVPEDVDLDFKAKLHSSSEGDTKEAAYDVAQLANASGGLLILGVAEDGEGRASSITGVQPVERDFGLWMHQVAATRISPSPHLVHRTVALSDLFVHLISVAPSVAAPHLVAVGSDGFRVPLRSGNSRRWIHEAELADRYRRRFSELSTREALTDKLQEDGAKYAPYIADNEEGAQKWWSWLVLTLVPDTPGQLELRRGVQESWRDWLRPALRDFPNRLQRDIQAVNLGFRSLTLTDSMNSGDPVYALGGQLELDGNGVLALGHPGGRGSIGISETTSAIYDEHLIGDLLNGVATLAEHAIRCGAAADVTVSARLLCRRLPMGVGQYRSQMSIGTLYGSHAAGRETGISRHTIPLESLLTDGRERVLGARLLGADLLSAFGLPEPQQITTDLELVRNCFANDIVSTVEQWAERHHVPFVQNLPGD